MALLGWSNRAHVAAFPGIIGAYSAKEYCSCRYVSGNPITINQLWGTIAQAFDYPSTAPPFAPPVDGFWAKP